MKRVLVIEDSEEKWKQVEPILLDFLPKSQVVRVADVFEGEKLIEQPGWDLLLLDVSLDIRAKASGSRGTHDFQAGLKIASRMFYLECEVPTIIVTGFDSFPTGVRSAEQNVILGLEDVESAVRSLIGDRLIATVRYLTPGWQDSLRIALREWQFA